QASGGIRLSAEVVRLQLRHTWTTTMSSSNFRDTLHLALTSGGITGHGEGAPIVRYHEDAAHGKQVLDSLAPSLAKADPMEFRKLLGDVFARVEGEWAAKSALDIALHDWIGKKLGLPLYRWYG